MTIDRLLRFYPEAWRERYGAELASLLDEGELSWRVQLDVIRGGLIQRARQSGLAGDDVPATEQLRAGVLLVLCAWSVFVVAGCAFAKLSEHWQNVTPGDSRGWLQGRFNVLLLAAELGTVAVLIGIAVSLSAFVAFLRAGGWVSIRRPILRAAIVSAATVAVSGGLVFWAHHLTNGQRNGGDSVFGAAFVVWALFIFGSIALWTVAAVAAGAAHWTHRVPTPRRSTHRLRSHPDDARHDGCDLCLVGDCGFAGVAPAVRDHADDAVRKRVGCDGFVPLAARYSPLELSRSPARIGTGSVFAGGESGHTHFGL